MQLRLYARAVVREEKDHVVKGPLRRKGRQRLPRAARRLGRPAEALAQLARVHAVQRAAAQQAELGDGVAGVAVLAQQLLLAVV